MQYDRPGVQLKQLHHVTHPYLSRSLSGTPRLVFLMSRPPTPPINESLAITSWHPILEASNQVVLYNPTSKALSITSSASSVLPVHQHAAPESNLCALCHRPLPEEETDDRPARHAPNYFQLLSDANDTISRPSTPPPRAQEAAHPMTADGYFEKFFKEEYRLGMGANGSVYLCQVRLFASNRLVFPVLTT